MPASRLLCRSYEELVEFLPQWEGLVERSDRNVFYEPGLLLPALKYLAADQKPFVVLVFDDAEQKRLIGLFPTTIVDSFRRMRLRHFANWKYEHAFFCAPLIEKGREDACIEIFIAALQDDQPDISSFCFENLDHDTPLFGSLSMQQGFASHSESYERAQLDVGQFDPTKMLTGKHRKDLRRRERRLADLGELTVHFDEARTNLNGWINDFLALEASGWKGENGTAMACTDNDKQFFIEAIRALGTSNHLLVTSMRLDGKLVAGTCDLLSGDRASAFKIAYDESLGRYSPGIIVAMKHAENLKQDGRLAWADSCAQKDSEMANRLYPERRTISSIMLSMEATAAGLVTGHVLPKFRAATSRLSQAASAIRGNGAKK